MYLVLSIRDIKDLLKVAKESQKASSSTLDSHTIILRELKTSEKYPEQICSTSLIRSMFAVKDRTARLNRLKETCP